MKKAYGTYRTPLRKFNLYIIGVPGGKEGKRGWKFIECNKLGRDLDIQIQTGPQIISTQRDLLQDIIRKLKKSKTKNLKNSKRK